MIATLSSGSGVKRWTGLKYIFLQEYKINTKISDGDSSGTADFLFTVSNYA